MNEKTKKILIGVGAFLVLGAICAAVFGEQKAPAEPAKKEPEKAQEANKNEKGGYMLSDIDASTACEEQATKLVSSEIAVISAANYNHNFLQTYGYDANNDSISLVTWNGKNKTTGAVVSFGCYLSATDKDNVKILSLTLDNESLFGSLDF